MDQRTTLAADPREVSALRWGPRIGGIEAVYRVCGDELLTCVLLTAPDPFIVTMTKNPLGGTRALRRHSGGRGVRPRRVPCYLAGSAVR